MLELVACIRRCYGETYAEPGFYDVDWLIAELRSQRLISIGACDQGSVVGHVGAIVRTAGDAVGDTVAGMVQPDYRGRGLVHQMGRPLFAAFQQRGILATRHFATGAHLRTQHPLADSGAIPTGVLLGHIPAGTRSRGLPRRVDDRRGGVVVYFQRYGVLEDLDVHLPAQYAPILTDLYERAGLTRHVALPRDARIATRRDEPTAEFAVRYDARSGIVVVRITGSSGTRIAIDELADVADGHRAEVVYIDVPLTHPGCPAAVDRLRDRGFVFGALLPGSADAEYLRMQRVPTDRVTPGAIECATDEGAQLRAWITNELEAT